MCMKLINRMKKNIVILTNSDTENMYKYKTCTNIKHPVAYITRLIPKEIIGLIVL